MAAAGAARTLVLLFGNLRLLGRLLTDDIFQCIDKVLTCQMGKRLAIGRGSRVYEAHGGELLPTRESRMQTSD